MQLRDYLSKINMSISKFSKDINYSRTHTLACMTGKQEPGRKFKMTVEKFTNGEVTGEEIQDSLRIQCMKHKDDKEYCTYIPNSIIDDKNISCDAKVVFMLMIYLLQSSEISEISEEILINRFCKEDGNLSPEFISKGFNELKEKGYLSSFGLK